MLIQKQCHDGAAVVTPRSITFNCRRARYFATLIFCGAVSTMVHAESADVAARKRAALDFSVLIPPVLNVQTLSTPRTIHIEEEHVAQGYVDLRDASSLAITSNHRGGFQVSVQIDSALVESVEVRLMDRVVRVAGGLVTMVVSTPPAGDHRVGVSYRLYLKRGVGAGAYRWPVALTFSPQSV
jgi:hypothetical protein